MLYCSVPTALSPKKYVELLLLEAIAFNCCNRCNSTKVFKASCLSAEVTF